MLKRTILEHKTKLILFASIAIIAIIINSTLSFATSEKLRLPKNVYISCQTEEAENSYMCDEIIEKAMKELKQENKESKENIIEIFIKNDARERLTLEINIEKNENLFFINNNRRKIVIVTSEYSITETAIRALYRIF
jgi:hypothetical protein